MQPACTELNNKAMHKTCRIYDELINGTKAIFNTMLVYRF